MKALVYLGPRQLAVQERPKPVPKAGEVLLKIKACGICGSDVHGYLGITGRRTAPMVMGHEFSAQVEALGPGVESVAVGDRVTVQPANFCGTCEKCGQGLTNVCADKQFFGVLDCDGAFQEYLCVPAKLLYKLPDSISYEEGALLEALAVSYCGVKKAGPLTGKNVLVVGGGTIGQLALMVAKTQNPKRIILSDLSTARLEIARKLGADVVINPKDKDFRAEVQNALDGELVDAAFEAVGAGPTVAQALDALKPQGTCVWIGNSAKIIEVDMQAVVTRELKIFGTYIYTHEEFGETIDFMGKNKLNFRPVISETIPLERAPELFEALVTETEQYLKVIVRFD